MIRRFARPYAKAIFEAAKSAEEAQKVHRDLARFDEARRSSEELVALLDNPAVTAEARGEIVEKIATRLVLSEMSRRVLAILVQNYRINDVGAIAEALRAMINESLNVAVARVRSAHTLSDEEIKRLQGALEKKLGRKVEVELTTDPSILGGFVAQVGSEIYDASVLGRIEKLREAVA